MIKENKGLWQTNVDNHDVQECEIKALVSLLTEWVEFSPYEIGMPKYGAYMKSDLFGSKFFMGKLVKSYGEPPLHFLQGNQQFSRQLNAARLSLGVLQNLISLLKTNSQTRYLNHL